MIQILQMGRLFTAFLMMAVSLENCLLLILILDSRDLGNPVQQTSRTLEVVVKDIDDHPPQFNRQRNSVPITIEVEEEMAPGTKIGEVVAIDKDEGQNAQID